VRIEGGHAMTLTKTKTAPPAPSAAVTELLALEQELRTLKARMKALSEQLYPFEARLALDMGPSLKGPAHLGVSTAVTVLGRSDTGLHVFVKAMHWKRAQFVEHTRLSGGAS
jgi:hypothetical protein